MFTMEDGLPVPNLDIRSIGPLRALIVRDTGRMVEEEQEDGTKIKVRKRLRAEKEFAYVYWYCKKDFLPGYTTTQRNMKLKLKVGLAETWEPDEVVMAACEEVTELAVTAQDKLLESSRRLASQLLDMIDEMLSNNTRLIDFFRRPITGLTQEELTLRTAEIKSAKEEILKSGDMLKNIGVVISTIDELAAKRILEEKKNKRTALSSTETDVARYSRKIDDE